MERDTLQSEMVKVKSRRYFLDVEQRDTGKVLRIKESRIYRGQQGQQVIHIWEEDMAAFFVAFLKCLGLFATVELENAMTSLLPKKPGA